MVEIRKSEDRGHAKFESQRTAPILSREPSDLI